ncbi:MAG: cytochrome c oxidase subunit [Thermoanaerobaculia bacterium]|jgi:cytochrome c oxidase subunit 4|nr:cytochrome c oxidase subunit [Thermoanaerobaculia bacterium]
MADVTTNEVEHLPHAPHVHVTPMWIYLAVFFALAVGTVLTVIASRYDLDIWNTPIALFIATIKAVLVILFFMHVIHSTRLTWVVVIASFLWLGVLFVLTFADYLTRMWSIY